MNSFDHQVIDNLSTNESFEMFHTYLQQSIDKFAPKKTIYISKNKRFKNNWYTNALYVSSRQLSKEFKELKTTNTNESDRQLYTTKRSLYKKLVRIAKMSILRTS